MPLFVGSLSAIPKQFGNRLKEIVIAAGTVQVHKTVLLRTARILERFLKSKTAGWGLVSALIFSMALLCVSSIVVIIIIIIIIIVIVILVMIQ